MWPRWLYLGLPAPDSCRLLATVLIVWASPLFFSFFFAVRTTPSFNSLLKAVSPPWWRGAARAIVRIQARDSLISGVRISSNRRVGHPASSAWQWRSPTGGRSVKLLHLSTPDFHWGWAQIKKRRGRDEGLRGFSWLCWPCHDLARPLTPVISVRDAAPLRMWVIYCETLDKAWTRTHAQTQAHSYPTQHTQTFVYTKTETGTNAHAFTRSSNLGNALTESVGSSWEQTNSQRGMMI